MKRIKLLCALLALAMCFSLFSCAGKNGGEPDESESNNESESVPGAPSELETAPDAEIGTGVTPELGKDTGGVYTDNKEYIPAATVDGKDVVFSGSYDKNTGVTEGPSVPDKKPVGDSTDPTQPTEQVKIDPPTEDIYKKALNTLGSYTADISFCYYVDMDDGWHESHPSRVQVSYDAQNDSYVGKTLIGKNEYAVYYANGIYTNADGKEEESPIDIFLRQCNYVTPLELDAYNFEMTEDVTAVSALLNASDHRYKLLMASNFFNGYEEETNTRITMGELIYSARISSEGRLLSTKYEYKFENASKSGNMHMTVVIDTLYE